MASVPALFRKELRLQRTNLFFAAAVGLVWLLMLGFAWFPNHPLRARFFTSGDLAQWVHILFVLPCLYGLIPMMAGASAIAEERRLRTLDWQLAQPARRWKQWAVKAAVAVLIALASGAFATLADAILVAILHAHQPRSTSTTQIIGPSMVWLRGLWPGEYSLLAVAVGAFASSLLRDAYRALLLALALAFCVHWISTWIDPGSLSSALWGGLFPARFLHPTIHYLMAAALAGLIVLVAGSGFRLERVRLRGLSIQIVCLAVGILATTWVTLHVEYHIPVDEAAYAHTSEGKGLTLLFMQDTNGHQRSEIQREKIRWVNYSGVNAPRETRLFRLPGTNRVLVDMQMYGDLLRGTSGEMPDIQQIRRALGKADSSHALDSQGGIPHRIFELNLRTRHVSQNPNLIGTLFSVSTVKPCFSVWTLFEKNLAVCDASWPWLRSDFKFDPRQCLTAPDRFEGEKSLTDENILSHAETDLDAAAQVVAYSPDGHYWAQARFHTIQDKNRTQLRVTVLDLKTRKETVLASTERPGLVQAWHWQDPYSSPPICCKWSKSGVLGALMANRLYLFQSPPGGGVPTQLGVIPVHAIGPSDFAFWSDTVILLWNRESIWRLDLKKTAMQPAATPVTNPPHL